MYKICQRIFRINLGSAASFSIQEELHMTIIIAYSVSFILIINFELDIEILTSSLRFFFLYTYIYLYFYIYVYAYLFVCLYVCTYVYFTSVYVSM